MDVHRLADNRTPMSVRVVPIEDRRGRDVALVVAKMAYAITPRGVVSAVLFGAPIRLSDVPTSGDRWSSVRYPGDVAEEKPGTDVILAGTAHPPYDRRVTEHDVRLRMELGARTLQKTVRVYGPRVFYETPLGVIPGPPAGLGPTPLCYELAYGGVDETDPSHPVFEHRNPSGVGFAVDRARLVGTRAPAIEDPARPLGSPSPAPAGFGPIPAHWSPRAERAGTYDSVWRRDRAPLPPADFDPRHNSCADPDLWSEAPLAGDEPVEILGATEEGAWRFRLPRYEPVIEVIRRDGGSIERPHLDTFLIDADAGRVELTFRVALPVSRGSSRLELVRIREAAALPERIEVTA